MNNNFIKTMVESQQIFEDLLRRLNSVCKKLQTVWDDETFGAEVYFGYLVKEALDELISLIEDLKK